MSTPLLKMEGITKVYSNGIVANQEVDFSVEAGEIHALMGENGAGKSTLMNILFGTQKADSGKVYYQDKEIQINSPMEAIQYGIGMVHQHFTLVPSLTVFENIFLGMEPQHFGFLDRSKAIRQSREIAKKYNFNLDPMGKIEDLSVGTKQKVEILKALVRGAKILILDEPTAVLTPQETDELFKELLLFKQEGHTIIFISHKLKEIKQICDRITIMKRGRSMGCYSLGDKDESDISRLMVGRDVIGKVAKRTATPGEKVLEAVDLSCYEDGKAKLNGVNITVRSGEILGIAGVEGNGQQELAECVAGLREIQHGQIYLEKRPIAKCSVRKIRAMGLSYVSNDRIGEGCAGVVSIENNLVADKMRAKGLTTGPFLRSAKINALAKKLVKDYHIVCDSEKAPVSMLSGGNMQKVVIAREFSGSPKMILANQPTRGVDVGAMSFIHQKLVELRDGGAAVMLISADLNEVLELSDSLVILYGGEVVAYFKDASTIDEQEMGTYMLGLKRQPEFSREEACQDD